MTKLVLDPGRTRVRIRTFAEGLFARLAHDLELECRGVTGAVAEDGKATLEVPIARIEVGGTLRDGHVDPRGLSASDRTDCLAKMRSDVFHVRDDGDAVRVEATLEAGGDKALLRIVPPNGRAFERAIPVVVERSAAMVKVTGKLPVSLQAIGSSPVKGPMNAFRVKDEVAVLFEGVFTPA